MPAGNADSCLLSAGSPAPLLVVCGPTASGKSRLALCLAGRLGGEIISADAFQFYRGLDIGTAKPDAAEQALVRHHFIDCLEPGSPASAYWFAAAVRRRLPRIRARGRVPILVGGSGLYIRAVVDGFFTLPPAAAAALPAAREKLAGLSAACLYRQLATVDPEAAARIHPADVYRLRRALAVFLAAGRPLSVLQRENRPRAERACFCAVYRAREDLYARIDRRVEAMFAAGFTAEVAALKQRCDFRAPAFAAIGYRETAAMLEGRLPRAEALALIKRRTRQYARRQLTWFRRERRIAWLDLTGREL